eukprot:s414_g7.t1
MPASSLAALFLLWLPEMSQAGASCSGTEASMLQMGSRMWPSPSRRRAVTTQPPEPETKMPDYTVQLSGKGGNLGFLVFDAQTTWEKAMEEAGKYLMQQQLVSVEGAVHGAVVIPPCSADAAAADAPMAYAHLEQLNPDQLWLTELDFLHAVLAHLSMFHEETAKNTYSGAAASNVLHKQFTYSCIATLMNSA